MSERKYRRKPNDQKAVSGAPRVPDDQLRRRSLTIYITDAQFERAEAICHALGYVSLADLGRLAIEQFLSSPGLLAPPGDGEPLLRQVARLIVAGIVKLGDPPMDQRSHEPISTPLSDFCAARDRRRIVG